MPETPLLTTSLKIFRRELRSGVRRFGVFFTCIFLGVFAIAAVGSFTSSALRGLLADAASLLGGDIEVRLVHRQLEADQYRYLEKLGEVSKVASMRTMAFDADGPERALVELKAVDSLYPLYGETIVEPAQQLQDGLAAGALVEENLLIRLQMDVGDKLRIGATEFLINGVLKNEPDRVIRAFNLGPRVMISNAGLLKTGLIQPGSLVNYRYRLKLPAEVDARQTKETIEQQYPDANWRIRTWHDAAPRVRRVIDRMNTNLTLLGLCALLVGGLGVSGAVRGYLDGKMLNIATMKCLGASSRVIFTSYLFQVLFIGSLAAGCGLLLAASVPFLIESTIGQALPIPFAAALFPMVLISAALFGLLIALIFSLNTLGRASQISPAVLFRGYAGTASAHSTVGIKITTGIMTLALIALTLLSSSDMRMAVWFIIGASACFLLFRVATKAVIALSKRIPLPSNPQLALGLRNIYRRGSPARSVMFSLGLGLTSLVLIALVQANLSALVDNEIPRDAPAFFLLDIQPDQVDAFQSLVKQTPAIISSNRYPTLRGRIVTIKGIPVAEANISPDVEWAIRGDRFLSYAEQMPEGTEIIAGQWWDNQRETGQELVSITADLAEGFGVDIGDTISVDLLGREVTAEIGNIRKVDWSNMKLNFALLFAPGILNSAPQTHLASVNVSEADEADVFKAITDRFPNVSVIGIREVLENVSRNLSRLGTTFSLMAALALVVSLLVLAGALSADQHRRLNDAIIFKVCGATRIDIVLCLVYEFLFVGLCAGTIATLTGSLAAWGILTQLMNSAFTLYPKVIITTIVASIILTLALGLMGTWKALGQRPSLYLRE